MGSGQVFEGQTSRRVTSSWEQRKPVIEFFLKSVLSSCSGISYGSNMDIHPVPGVGMVNLANVWQEQKHEPGGTCRGGV